jgi:hypothetical protein
LKTQCRLHDSVGCGNTIQAIPRHIYLALEGALEAKTKAERDLKLYTNMVIIIIIIIIF